RSSQQWHLFSSAGGTFLTSSGNFFWQVEQARYGITDIWDEIVKKMMEIVLTTLEGVNERVTEMDTIVKKRTDEFEEFNHTSLCQDFKDTCCCTEYPDYITIGPVDYGTWTHRGTFVYLLAIMYGMLSIMGESQLTLP
nr:hypothetical protein [Tanacetum cinerariifolium]